MTFGECLRSVSARVPEARALMIMGTDGLPIEKLVLQPDPGVEAVAAEYTALLKSSVVSAQDTGLGELHELCVVTEKLVALLVAITSDYFLFAALAPGALAGRARFALRLASLQLEREFR